MIFRILLAVSGLLLTVFLSACGKEPLYQEQGYVFGTLVEVSIYGDNEEHAKQAIAWGSNVSCSVPLRNSAGGRKVSMAEVVGVAALRCGGALGLGGRGPGNVPLTGGPAMPNAPPGLPMDACASGVGGATLRQNPTIFSTSRSET